MNTYRWITGLALAAALLVGCGRKHPSAPEAPAAPVSLATAVARARAAHDLPALAVASFTLDSIEVATDGVRRLGGATPVTPADLFHVGSLAKSLTATEIGALVDRGTLGWSLTLADAFPELAATMDSAYRDVTLAELLQNRSGMPGWNEYEEMLSIPDFPGDAPARRQAFVAWALAQPPAVARGTYRYSTAAFAVAAAIAERRTGRTWDALVSEDVLAPLGATMFVGWPLEAGPGEPSGHVASGAGLEPVDPSAGHIPSVLAPGGDVSMTVGGFARYAQLHLRALCGSPAQLTPATWTALHSPVGDYAMGWSVLEGSGNTVLMHTGDSATFHAFVVLYRAQRHGFVVLANASTPAVDDAILDLLNALAPGLSAGATTSSLARTR